VTFRTHTLIAAAAGLWMALPLPGQEPARLDVDRGPALPPRASLSADQTLADSIAEQLRQSGQLHQYRIDINVQNGTAELSGTVVDQPQREEALRLVQGVPGVERVRDHLALSGAITQVQGKASAEQAPPPGTEQTPPPRAIPPVPPVPTRGPAAAGEPMPMYQAPTPAPYDLTPPALPSYSWPTYAPYNNFSRVAYPEAYPYQSWPFIGPCYPFPKVPLGWRSVKLQWEDGHWWFSKTSTKQDFWHFRFW
jgi:BON domain